MGAESVYDFVSKRIDLDQLALQLREEMQATSDVKRKKATNNSVAAFVRSALRLNRGAKADRWR